VSSYNKFNLFVEDALKGVYNFSTDAFKVMLTNTAPVATNHLLGDLTEIAAQNGYVAGGAAITVGLSNSSGTETVTGSNVVFTASGGSFGPFRYAVLYDTTPTSPLKPLVAWWDYGSSISLNNGETFTVAPGSGNLFTLV
jgi:hypothetical protein